MKVSRPTSVVYIEDDFRLAFRRNAERKRDRARRQWIATVVVILVSTTVVAAAGEHFGWSILPVAFVLLLILAIARWGTRA